MNNIPDILGSIEMPQLSFLSDISDPYRTILFYGIVIVGTIILCCVVGFVLKLLLKIIFKPIKFVFCLVIVMVLLGGFLIKSAVAPIQSFVENSEVGDVMAVVVDKFKGLYSSSAPLLAWRFTDVTKENSTIAGVFGEDDSDGKTYVRIDYLPTGSVIVEYDKKTQNAKVVESMD